MLTDSNVEEFDIKEDEPWYDQQDLQQDGVIIDPDLKAGKSPKKKANKSTAIKKENMKGFVFFYQNVRIYLLKDDVDIRAPNDLQLAAELGKTLLDRNTELEESLQQMYNTNQEQLQEIEYLTKQVELLRRMNEQHAKVYEQLDVTARDLENANQKLVLESRASQQKITSLTETIENLQLHLEELQRQVEDLKKPGSVCRSRERSDQSRSSQSFSCLKELYDLRKYFVYDHVFAEKIASLHSQPGPLEDENCHLKKALSLLESQLNLERKKRESLEDVYSQVVKENSELEQMLRDKDLFHARAEELEAEVAEMRQICRSDSMFASSVEKLIPESILISFKEKADRDADQEVIAQLLDVNKKPLKRSTSELLLPRAAAAETILNGHEETCIRKAEVIKQRGISLLNEVDSQYSALKVKYEELLQKCQLDDDDDGFSNPGVQTTKTSSLEESPPNDLEPSSPKPVSPESPPEYKVLFQEIFTCIKKTKEEIHEQRTKYKYPNAASS